LSTSDHGCGGDVSDGHAVQGGHPRDAEPVLIGKVQGADEAQVHAEVRQVIHAVLGGEAGQDVLEEDPRVRGDAMALGLLQGPHVDLHGQNFEMGRSVNAALKKD